MSEFTQGLIVSVLGLGITFAALGFIVLLISLLTHFFQSEVVVEVAGASETAIAAAQVEEVEIAIAIALALNHWHASAPDQLGIDLEVGHSAWWKPGRLPTLVRRTK